MWFRHRHFFPFASTIFNLQQTFKACTVVSQLDKLHNHKIGNKLAKGVNLTDAATFKPIPATIVASQLKLTGTGR